MIKIFAYNPTSRSAKHLATALGVKRLKHNNSRWHPTEQDTVINWGMGRMFNLAFVLNEPINVSRVVNKLSFFQMIAERNREFPEDLVNIPEWTTDIAIARSWCGLDCRGNPKKVVARSLLNSHEGKGITIHIDPETITIAPLYCKYVPKQTEYRVHMVGSKIIDIQKKILRNDIPRDSANWTIRNTANGFVFQRQNIVVPEDVKTQALLALKASGLDFAAADVIWNNRRGKAYVLELNTAPGIEGTTVILYSNALRKYIEDNQD